MLSNHIDSIQNYTRGKLAKAEFWIANLIDWIGKAQAAGTVPKDVMDKAYDLQYDATLYWEWWTAENSDGFHNPENARESLTRSIDASQEGIALLKKALGADKAPAAVGNSKTAAQKKPY